MNVKELKELINDLPDNMEVILQKDAEGNAYSPLNSGNSNRIYLEYNLWSGDVYNINWNADDADMTKNEWEAFKQKPRVLVLEPLN